MTDIETALRAVPPVLVCQQFHVHASDDCYAIDYPALAAVVQGMVEEKEGQRQAWEDTAAQAYRNTDYYRSLVREIGMMIGSAAYIADDGTVNDDVLCAKVPELIRTTLAEQAREIERLRAVLADIEWIPDHEMDYLFCPACDETKPVRGTRHAPDCPLAVALR